MESQIAERPAVKRALSCFHCGQACETSGVETYSTDEHIFCCFGCMTVYEILRDNNLCNYYELQAMPGSRVEDAEEAYAGLGDPEIAAALLSFKSDKLCRVIFDVPAVHCISCIWLLENLHRLEPAIVRSEVNFARKDVTISYRPVGYESGGVSLRRVAQLMAKIGYAPRVSLESDGRIEKPAYNKQLLLKLAVAGFAFGNIMLLSFPEYLGLDNAQVTDHSFSRLFGWLNMALSVPVILYSASDYFRSAWHSIRNRQINLDVPLALGMVALFVRSGYDIIASAGPGYLDSFCGLLFFLLLGRWFQQVTFENLSFDRDFKSFFPLSVQVVSEDQLRRTVLVNELKSGDIIEIRNQEIIPCDSEMLDPEALADYSFVTGESRPVLLRAGELVYAGGRLLGKPVRMKVRKEIRQGHLTSLWNSEAFQKPVEMRFRGMVDRTARRFTWILLAVATCAALYWYAIDASRVWLVVSSILIVACPCALALSAPFTFGHMMRIFGRNGMYAKNTDVLERMSAIDSIVFDKTGTLTTTREDLHFEGDLKIPGQLAVAAVAGASAHPLSIRISQYLRNSLRDYAIPGLLRMEELPGKGITACTLDGTRVRLGSVHWIVSQGSGSVFQARNAGSYVYVEIDGKVAGRFYIGLSLREGLKLLLARLGDRCTALLSGDNARDEHKLRPLFPKAATFRFSQSPTDKMNFIRSLGESNHRVMMVGDGLNDAGALRQSEVGVAVTDDTGVFTPSCDAILKGESLPRLDWFLEMSRRAATIVRWCFVLSLGYNIAGLAFAVTGNLTPLVAAILMPMSSISVVLFTTLAVRWAASTKTPAA